jgi:membrane protease YdiL (CAAX protease family)
MNPFLSPEESRKGPEAIEGMIVYILALAYTIVAGRVFRNMGGYSGVALFTLGLGLLPVLYSLARGYGFTAVFRISLPRKKDVAGGLFISAGMFIFVLFVCNAIAYLIPPLKDAGTPLQDFMVHGGVLPAVITVALLPAVCEELLFRGFLLSGFASSMGKWPAIILCGCLFGALHLQPFQMPFTALVGVGLAYAALETGSVFVPVIMHCAHNLLLLLIVRAASVGAMETADAQARSVRGVLSQGPGTIAVFAAMVAVLALTLVGFSLLFVSVGARIIRTKPPVTGETSARGEIDT